MNLHELALDTSVSIGHSPCDTLYVAFALATGAAAVVVAGRPFAEAMRRHPDPVLARILLPLDEWAGRGS